MKVFRDLPLTLSSEIEGWLLEAYYRLDSRIGRMDIRARMPRQIRLSSGKAKDLFGLSALGNKRWRFRTVNGLASWEDRAGTAANKDNLKQRMPQRAVEANTTRGCEESTNITQKESLAKSILVHPHKRSGGKTKKKQQPHNKITAPNQDTTPNRAYPTQDTTHRNVPYWPGGSRSHSPEDALTITGISPSTQAHKSHSHSPTDLGYAAHQSPPMVATLLNPYEPVTTEPGPPAADSPYPQDCPSSMPSLEQGEQLSTWRRSLEAFHYGQADTTDELFGDQRYIYDGFKQLNDEMSFSDETINASVTQPPDITGAAGTEMDIPNHPQPDHPGFEDKEKMPGRLGVPTHHEVEKGPHQHVMDATSSPSMHRETRKRNRNDGDIDDDADSAGAPVQKRQRRSFKTASWNDGYSFIEHEYPLERLCSEIPENLAPIGGAMQLHQQLHEQTEQSQTACVIRSESRLALSESVAQGYPHHDTGDAILKSTQVPGTLQIPLQTQTQIGEQTVTPPSTSTSAQTGSSASPEDTSAPKNCDYRKIAPSTPWQMRVIQNILEYTRQDIYSWLRGSPGGVQILETEFNASYQDQYDQLVGGFAARWWLEFPRPPEIPPTLRGLEKWCSGWEEWRLEDLSPLV